MSSIDAKNIIKFANAFRDRYNEHAGLVVKTCKVCGRSWTGLPERFDHPRDECEMGDECEMVKVYEVMES